ncbi:pas fold [Desulfoluna butyratoxydans]|uniref:HTH-type transcriptional regulatory protein TyrR n=2 Tax=Desulfoluna butyratoxydans TaxID=231438 RepID=A0A4U8YQG4_9BACT|nr:pas fold [Desulfoluna butyratoxydans]
MLGMVRMEDILHSSSDGIWIWDAFGRVIAVNKKAEELGGIRADSLIGRCYIELIQNGLYDRSVAHDIFRSRSQGVTQAASLRTGVRTINTGTPYVNDRGEIVRIVVKEKEISHLSDEAALSEVNRIRAGFGESFEDPGVVSLGRYEVVAKSPLYRRLLKRSFKLADAGVSRLLVLGESGTGKGLLARLIHEKSRRREHPFVQLNCAAVPENLLESELFGYDGGAFTSARAQGKEGLFEAAHGGTLFLDEIGTLPLPLQAKLLKYLDDFEVTRLGSTRVQKVDCTVVAATNCDLKTLVKQGCFREDLYYRLNGFSLTIPSLRQRPEDIAGLLDHYIERYNRQYRLCRYPSQCLLDQLYDYPFPGNVRELKNIARQIVVLGECDLQQGSPWVLKGPERSGDSPKDLKGKMDAYEKEILRQAVDMHRTTREVGDYLGIDQSSVVRKLQKHGLSMGRKKRR